VVALLYRPAEDRRKLEKLAVTLFALQVGLVLGCTAASKLWSSAQHVLAGQFFFITVSEVVGGLSILSLAVSFLIRSDVGRKMLSAAMLWTTGLIAVLIFRGT
jgi:hypothetical protein